jgi:hypothetical protein
MARGRQMGGVSRHWPCETGAPSLEVGFEHVVGAESAGCMEAGKILLDGRPAAWLRSIHLLQKLKQIQGYGCYIYLQKRTGIASFDCSQYVRHFTQVNVWIDYNILSVSVCSIINIRRILKKKADKYDNDEDLTIVINSTPRNLTIQDIAILG